MKTDPVKLAAVGYDSSTDRYIARFKTTFHLTSAENLSDMPGFDPLADQVAYAIDKFLGLDTLEHDSEDEYTLGDPQIEDSWGCIHWECTCWYKPEDIEDCEFFEEWEKLVALATASAGDDQTVVWANVEEKA
jgi:hypothetical protein